jgi:NAD(P)-dependent dehydrogenase (short-subunit alcohol dehydrogenase family)
VLALRELLESSPAPRVVVTSSVATLLPNDPDIVAACLEDDEPRARSAGAKSTPDPTGRARVYSSTKTALSQWMRQTAPRPEWAGAGILLNAVAPGTTATPMMADVLASEDATRSWMQFLPNTQDRFATAAEVAEVMVWLASPQNSLLVGQELFADLGTELGLRS